VKNHARDTAVALGQPCGPLSFHILGFAASLASQGYTKTSIAYKFALVRALDRWMQQRRMPLDHFNEERIEQFLHYRWRRYSNLNYARISLDLRWKPEFRPHQFFLASALSVV
jgi:hypothetical protein